MIQGSILRVLTINPSDFSMLVEYECKRVYTMLSLNSFYTIQIIMKFVYDIILVATGCEYKKENSHRKTVNK